MALGDLAKQLAEQALPNPAKIVMEALRPPDLSRLSESARAPKPAGPAPSDNVCATIVGQVQAMQRALKDDEELVVLCGAGGETLRVLEFFVPAWPVVVLSGIDTDRNITRVVSHIESVPLVCKVMKVQPPAKAARIGFVIPKPKE